MGGRVQRLPPRCIADNDDGGGNLKKSKSWRGVGGRAQRLPPRCIADNDDGGLCLEPVVVVVVGHYGLEFVGGTGAGGVGAVRGGNLKK